MNLRIGLYHDLIRHGGVELDTVFVMVPADYTCEPKGIVTHDEVTQIAKVLRRAPDIETGMVGEFAWCKEQHQTKRVPIVALTADVMTGEREKFIAAGGDGYISKPVAMGELVDLVKRWAKYARSSKPS